MASTPVVPAPAAPIAPATPAIQQSAHSPEDKIANKISAAMAGHTPAGPVIPPLNTQVSPANPDAALPAAGDAPAVVSEPSFSIDNIDFDNPPTETTVAAPNAPAPASGETRPQIPDATLEGQIGEMLSKGELPEKIEEVFLKHSRGKQMLTAFKRDRELSKPPSEGGIGRVPTIDEIRAGDVAYRTNTVMRDEFQSNPESFVRNILLVNPETGTNNFGGAVDHVRQVVQTIPRILQEALANADPQSKQAYGQLYSLYSTPVFKNFLNYQYDTALQMPGAIKADGQPDESLVQKARWLDALQLVEYRLFGRARSLNLGPTNGQPTQQSTQPDPEKQQLMQRLNQVESALQDTHRRSAQAAQETAQSKAKADVMSDLDTLFKTAKVDVAYPAEIISSLKDTMYVELSNILHQHDPGGYQTYQLQMGQAARGQIDPSIPAATYRQLFRNALRGNSGIRERMNNIVKGAKQSLDSQNSSLANSQNRVEVNGSGLPARSSVVPMSQLQRQPGEDLIDYNARKFRAASESVLPRRS